MNDLPSLTACLQALPNRQLRALASSLRVSLGADYDRSQWLASIRQRLLDETHLTQMLANLPAEEKRALRMLLEMGGQVGLATFQEQFGRIRIWRPWLRKEAIKPWEQPGSPAEALFYSGLVFLWPWQPEAGQLQRIVLPEELYELIQRQLKQRETRSGKEIARPGHPPDLRWHMVVFLGAVAEEPTFLVRDHWLPPNMLNRLVDRFGLASDPEFHGRRSERLMPYVAFIHWLALASGLVAHGNQIQITVRGWQWLGSGLSDQWRMLWEGWLVGDGEMALRYGLAWGALAPNARRWLAAKISKRLDEHGRLGLDDLTAWLHLQDERAWLAQPWELGEDVARLVLRQPLWWLPILALFEQPDGQAYTALTRVGRWLTGRGDRPPAWPSAQRGYLDPKDNTLIHATVLAPARPLVALTRWATWETSRFPAYEVRLRLTEAKVARAAARGESLYPLAEAIEELVGRPTSRRLQQRLRGWMKQGQKVRFRRLVVMETESPALLSTLHRRRRIRRHTGEVIGPRRIVVHPHGQEALVRQLETMGLYVNPLPVEAANEASHGEGMIQISPAEAGFLLAAARVFRGLGEYAPLLAEAPEGLLMRLAESLSHDEDAAAAFLADETLKSLAQLVQGYDGLPGWFSPPQALDPMPVIREALASQKMLSISYWLPACAQVVERRVTPYFLEMRADYAYLVGYCHLREDERVFRVDRILQVEIVEEPDDGDDS